MSQSIVTSAALDIDRSQASLKHLRCPKNRPVNVLISDDQNTMLSLKEVSSGCNANIVVKKNKMEEIRNIRLGMKNSYEMLVRKAQGKTPFCVGTDGRIIADFICKKRVGKAAIVLIGSGQCQMVGFCEIVFSSSIKAEVNFLIY
jgi:hypothetical protein